MYQQLQNLIQGSELVDTFTIDFYILVANVDLAESDDQLVSRYIGVMRQNFQDSLNLYLIL